MMRQFGWRRHAALVMTGALLAASALFAGCGSPSGHGSPPDATLPDGQAFQDASTEDGSSDAGGEVSVAFQVTTHAVDRCGSWAPDHQPGLSFQTPTGLQIGVQSLELMRSHKDPSPVTLPLDANVVVVDASAGGAILDVAGVRIPPGTYTHVRVGLAFARYELGATVHQGGISAPGTLEMNMSLSDHEYPVGQLRAQGAYTATFTAFGQTYTFSGSTPFNCTLSAWGGIAATTGTRFQVRVPIPGGPVVVAPGRTDPVAIALEFPMEDTYAWRDLDESGFSPGTLDLAQPPAVTELPDSMLECNLLMTDRCQGDVVVPIHPSWPMPDSSIDFCSDGTQVTACPAATEPGFGQDAQYVVNPLSYQPDADTVLDQVTGLVWQRRVAIGTYDWWEARGYCAGLDLAGHQDWRLPSRVELVSLLDFGQLDPTIDLDAFPDTPSDFFWSGSPVPFLNLAYGVRFELGFIYDHDPTGSGRVRCVRSAPTPPDPRFTFTDEVVDDHGTGLEWQRGHFDARLWLDALSTCEGLDLAGHQDWRLPTLKELQTLVDDRRLQPSIDVVAFPDTPSEWFWSSTPIQFPPDEGWATSFTDGYASIHAFTELHVGRCVRDP